MADLRSLPDPICRSREAASLAKDSNNAHPGLLFERFARLMDVDGAGYAMKGGRDAWLGEFIRKSKHPSPMLERYHRRLDALCNAWGGQRRIFETKSRLAIGLGNPNAGDIGFSLDHATGLPLIPGSSIKGLALAGARLLGENAGAEQLLGKGPSPDGRDRGHAGVVIFPDAMPETWPPSGQGFEIDVITRHHDPESLNMQRTPLDADEPNPVHFLVLGSGARFVFRLLPLAGASNDDIAVIWRWLDAALSQLGAGGKTAVGYGEMHAADGSPSREARTASDPLADLNRLAAAVTKSNAAQVVSQLLGELQAIAPSKETNRVAREVVQRLGRRWVQARVGKTPWAEEILSFLDTEGAKAKE